MKPYPRFRQNYLAAALLSHLSPLPLGLGLWWLLENFTNYSSDINLLVSVGAALGLGVVFALIHFMFVARPIKLIDEHVNQLNSSNYRHRTREPLKGIFGDITAKLNRLSDKLQELFSSSQAQTAVVAAEANRLRNVINSINDGVFALDKDRRVILFNKAAGKITGFSIA